MDMVAILIMWPDVLVKPLFPFAHEGSIWNLALMGPVVSEEKTYDECGQWTDGRWMKEPAYTVSSPMSLKVQVS